MHRRMAMAMSLAVQPPREGSCLKIDRARARALAHACMCDSRGEWGKKLDVSADEDRLINLAADMNIPIRATWTAEGLSCT